MTGTLKITTSPRTVRRDGQYIVQLAAQCHHPLTMLSSFDLATSDATASARLYLLLRFARVLQSQIVYSTAA